MVKAALFIQRREPSPAWYHVGEFEFAAIPRIGEDIIADIVSSSHVQWTVVSVTHTAKPAYKTEEASPLAAMIFLEPMKFEKVTATGQV